MLSVAEAAPVLAAALFGLLGFALLAVSTAELLIGSNTREPSQEPRAPRRRRRGAAASLAQDVSPTRWRQLEKLVMLNALLDVAGSSERTGHIASVNAKHICCDRLSIDAGRKDPCTSEPVKDAICSICLEVLRAPKMCGGDPAIVVLSCGHALHRECALQFLLKCSQRCPLCNTEFITEDHFFELESTLRQSVFLDRIRPP